MALTRHWQCVLGGKPLRRLSIGAPLEGFRHATLINSRWTWCYRKWMVETLPSFGLLSFQVNRCINPFSKYCDTLGVTQIK